MITWLEPVMAFLWFLPFIFRALAPAAKASQSDALRVPFIKDFAQIAKKNENSSFSAGGAQNYNKNFWLFMAVWTLLVMAAMRPVKIGDPVRVQAPARDILLVTDISTSMQETDFAYQGRRLDRLTAVKAVVSDFVTRRHNDRIGLILFGTRAYLQSPLTYDRRSVEEVLQSMSAGMAGDSTAIGDALGLALKTLKNSGEKLNSKIIILLTDGENNDGKMSLPQAVDLAREEGVKIYTVGVGGAESLMLSFFGIRDNPFDEASLKKLADETQGRYFHASDLNGLAQVYQAIDRLEAEEQTQNYVYDEQQLYYLPLLAALVLAIMAMMYFRRYGL